MSQTATHALDRSALAKVMELDLRLPTLTSMELQRGCEMARSYGLSAVCVPSSRVLLAVHFLEESHVKVVCAVGSLAGAMDPDVKRYETEAAIDNGAHAIELTANIGILRDGDHPRFLRELRDVVEAADERDVALALDINALRVIDFEQVLALLADSDAAGLSLLGCGDAADAQAVRRANAAASKVSFIKVERPKLTWEEVRALVEAGASRFGAAALDLLE